jgi:hypothetical protein
VESWPCPKKFNHVAVQNSPTAKAAFHVIHRQDRSIWYICSGSREHGLVEILDFMSNVPEIRIFLAFSLLTEPFLLALTEAT